MELNDINRRDLLLLMRERAETRERFKTMSYKEKCCLVRDCLIELYDIKVIELIKTQLPKLWELVK